jgi:hypothetical protein
MTLAALFLLGFALLTTVDILSVDGDVDLISCHEPGTDSSYGFSTWSMLPPGKVCHFQDGSTERPHWRIELISELGILAGGLAFGYSLLRLSELPKQDERRKTRRLDRATPARAP